MRFLALLLTLFSFSFTFAQKRIVLPVQDTQVYITDVQTAFSPKPGDTLVIPTGIISCKLMNFNGALGKPIVLVPKDSGWIGGYPPYAFAIATATYFKLVGFHIDGQKLSNLGIAIGNNTSDYEVANTEIKNIASIGLLAKQNPDATDPTVNWPNSVKNVKLNNLYIHNTVDEGGYIGYTYDIKSPLASPMLNLSAYNIRIDSTGRTGIQFGGCQGLIAHDITTSNTGMNKEGGHLNGINFGGETTLKDSAYNLNISNSTGAGLIIFARGVVKIRNAVITNVAQIPSESGIYVNDYLDLGYGLPPQQLIFDNVTVTGASLFALNVANANGTQLPGVITNFTYSKTGQGINDKLDKFITVPIIVKGPASKIITIQTVYDKAGNTLSANTYTTNL